MGLCTQTLVRIIINIPQVFAFSSCLTHYPRRPSIGKSPLLSIYIEDLDLKTNFTFALLMQKDST